MNEGKKTGIFWITAAIMLGVGVTVSWEPSSSQNDSEMPINQPLFEGFKDPLVAASMKIVTFDEGQGTLGTFEIRKDRESGNWTIPSRDGYPADAVEQMMNAANSLVDLRVLDTIVAEPKDHVDFGVVEPNLEDLNVGDEGVGRLVTFKDNEQKTLASMIIGDPVKDQEGQIYVRKPTQDLVYVVPLDDTPLTTRFQDWIEDDLLKISSIDIQDMEIKDYNASMNPLNGQISLNKKYDAVVALDGSKWTLKELKEYDPKNPLAEPKMVEPQDGQELNATLLNQIKNALDDVKIADVVRKPEGMSANLKADKDLAADVKAKQSLARHGFFPVQMSANGDVEILSANGELLVGLNDGVEYVLRFGNISGLSEDAEDADASEGEAKTTGGVNRYLLVTTRVNDAKFPPPDLKPIPQTVEDIQRLKAKEAEQEEPVSEGPPLEAPETATDSDAKDADEKDDPKPAADEADADKTDKTETTDEADAADKASEPATDPAPEGESEPAKDDAAEPAEEPATTGEAEVSGSGEASGSGQGQDPAAADETEQEAADDSKADNEKETEASESTEADAEPAKTDAEPSKTDAEPAKTDAEPAKTADEPAKAENESDTPADGDAEPVKETAADSDDPPAKGDGKQATETTEPAADPIAEMSAEEQQELLEAEQEKITKENQRALDERKDKIEAAKRRVRDLNARFADWYYVVPEDTYSKLRIKREDLFEKPGDAATAPAGPAGLNSLPPGTGFPPGFPPPQ